LKDKSQDAEELSDGFKRLSLELPTFLEEVDAWKDGLSKKKETLEKEIEELHRTIKEIQKAIKRRVLFVLTV
jgi:gas vesicle protein